ncbi:hypothetical protein BDR04DRAFT_1130108 [Suillus decipiens]|nr:hypothetical protein BDR04DRAFT_1130108 [Suillus decipiens]
MQHLRSVTCAINHAGTRESCLDYLATVLANDIKQNDIVLMVLLDGAQLYESKQSDCWMYVWIILNLSPDKQYWRVHVWPGDFIPGLNKPKNLDSFLFVSMHHLAALQKNGLMIWDASRNTVFTSDLYFLFTSADGFGLIYWDGMVGHSGKNGCHLYCGVRGRHGAGETGITKPLLILSLSPSQSLSVPYCMTPDIIHLVGNLSDLLLSLWHTTIDCATADNPAT